MSVRIGGLAALLLGVAFLLPAPLQAEADGQPVFSGNGIVLRDQVFDDLTIVRGNQVRLENVTVRMTLVVEESYDVQLTDVRVGRGAFLSRNVWTNADRLHVTGLDGHNQTGLLSVEQSWHVTIGHSRVNWKTLVSDVIDAHIASTAFGGPLCRSNAELAFFNNTFARKDCPDEGYVGPAGEGQESRLVVRDQVVDHDLRITQQGPVSILDTRIRGNLHIGWSHDINLENVTVEGAVVLDRTNGLFVHDLDVADRFESRHGVDFNVIYSSVGGALVCDACAFGSFGNVEVGGPQYITNSYSVQEPHDMTRPPPPGNATNQTQPPEPTPAPNGTAPRPVYEECASYEPCKSPPPHSEPTTMTSGPSWSSPVPPLPPLPTFPATEPAAGMDGSATAFSFLQQSAALDDRKVRLDVESGTGLARLELVTPDGTLLQLDSRFEKLIEFDDRDGNGAFDLGDQVVAEHLVAALPVRGLEQLGAGEGRPEWTGRVEYGLPGNGTLALTFTSRDGDGDRTKVDVGIHGYPYGLPTSQLALQVRLESASSWSITDEGEESRLSFHGREADGYFSWIRTADADGVPTEVTSRVLEEHKTADGRRDVVLFLGYARADDLVHDPSIGVVAGTVAEAAARLGEPLAVAAAFAATTVLLLALRRLAPPGKA